MLVAMSRKPAPKPANSEQYKRFFETAREADADEPGYAFDRVFDKVARSKPSPAKPKRGEQK
jgi:hypothetical protein